jgi:hypothetical protein
VELHETAAQLQEEGGWPARAAAAREQVDELKRREPQHRDGHAAGGKDTGAHHGRP